MFTVLLVEDEPAAMRYLRSVIERRCSEFSVVATATNGREALDRARQAKPDLIITDVKMPVMDGIDFVAGMKESNPQTPVIIVSGYQEFEYVRRALNTGVVDYVLKPVAPRRLVEVLERMRSTLQKNSDERTLAVVRAMVENRAGSPAAEGEIESELHLAILRCGGPPSRIPAEKETVGEERCTDGVCRIHGRDGREVLFVAPSRRISREDFVRLCSEEAVGPSGHYRTLLFAPREVAGGRLGSEVVSLYRQLDRAITLGLTQTLEAPVAERRAAAIDAVVAGRLEHAVFNADLDALEAIVHEEVGGWQREGLPVVVVESAARSLLRVIQRSSPRSLDPAELDSRLEERLVGAVGFADFEESLRALGARAAGLDVGAKPNARTSSLFESMRSQVESSYAKNLTVRSLCATFRISPSYVSRLFRRQTGRSFSEYLRQCRIEAAQKLIRESPAMPLKNVSRCVGFKDPFYFSRVFRTVTGASPSEFARRQATLRKGS